MATKETYLSTQSLVNRNATAEVHKSFQTDQMNTNRESKRIRTICQPKGTVPYTVEDRDTIEKIALQYNSIPSELLQLNKLHSRILFPGQVLYVPDEGQVVEDPNPEQSLPPPAKPPSTPTKAREGEAFVLLSDRHSSDGNVSALPPPATPHRLQADIGPMVWSMTRQLFARPGRAQRLQSNSSADTESTLEESQSTQKTAADKENQHLDDECLQRFIKLNVRLMTDDRQSVSGTLLVTPNALMFDPDVLDPLVKEHGIDKYGLILQMNLLAGIALYEDLSMFEHQATARDEEKRKMFSSTSVRHSQQSQLNQPLISDDEQIQDLMNTLLDTIEKQSDDSSSTSETCVLFHASTKLQRRVSKSLVENHENLPTSLDEFDMEDSFQPLNDYKHSIGILLGEERTSEKENYNHIPSQVSYVFDWTRFRRAVKVKKGCHLENCVPMHQFSKRFDEIDKLLHEQQQNYFAPHPIEIPYYLCVKTSVHSNDVPSLNARKYQKTSEKFVETVYGKKQLQYEYWFAVPKEKTDHLHQFFLRWTPERELDPLVDDIDELTRIQQNKDQEKSHNKGFVLLANEDPDLSDDYSSPNPQGKSAKAKKPHYLQRQNTLLKEWEIISVDEIYRRISTAHADSARPYQDTLPPPTFLQPSLLISEEQAKQILLELPIRLHGLNWHMIFSTEANGFSLNQLYRRSFELDRDLGALLVVRDIDQNIFGAFVSHQLTISESFYGNGESFLFTYFPDFRVFNWSGANEFFVKGDVNSLGFGSGDGTYGLWIDADLYHGRTSASKTFNNDPLTANEDFLIASIEVWTFVD